jgi:uncharacterized protein YprB with RNaseH-like and TPR domain
MNESLADKLRSLGVKTGAKDISPPQPASPGIEDVVQGNFSDTNYGPIFCSVTPRDNAYTHGIIAFNLNPISDRFIRWAEPNLDPAGIDLSRMLFLDTETTGLAGGTGTIPFMVGLGRFTPQGFITTQIFIRNPAEERGQLELLDRMLTGIDAIVTYNGKAFDVPILKTRYILNGFPSPLKDLAHFDLLPLSRRLWKRRLESRSLKDIESEIIGFTRDQIEVPGWEIPILYFNYLRTGDPRPLAGVFYHNVIDIQSLAAIFLLMNDLASEPAEINNLPPVDSFSLAIQMENSGEVAAAVSLYEQLLSCELSGKFRTELQIRYARILKRSGRYDHAAEVLQVNNSYRDISVMIQLAKVLEHQQRDYQTALDWTHKALDRLAEISASLSESEISRRRDDLTKRQARLCQKIELSKTHE